MKLGRFTLELDLTAITRDMDASLAVILSDGSRIDCSGGMGVASPEPGLETGRTVQFTLHQLIEPGNAVALEIEGVHYSLHDSQ